MVPGTSVFTHLFPAPALRGGVQTPELARLTRTTWERIEGPRQEMGVTDLVPLGLTLALTEPRGFEGSNGDWIAYPAAQEPWVQTSQFFLPIEEQSRLQRFVDLGLDMDDVIVVHQTPTGTIRHFGVDGVPPAVLGPPPSQRTVLAAQRLTEQARRWSQPRDFSGPAFAGGVALAAASLGLAGVVGMVGLTLAAMGSVAVGMDPILLGVVSTSRQPQPGDPVFLYLLSMYVWQEEGYHVIHATQ
jgi:hypothetical protein